MSRDISAALSCNSLTASLRCWVSRSTSPAASAMLMRTSSRAEGWMCFRSMGSLAWRRFHSEGRPVISEIGWWTGIAEELVCVREPSAASGAPTATDAGDGAEARTECCGRGTVEMRRHLRHHALLPAWSSSTLMELLQFGHSKTIMPAAIQRLPFPNPWADTRCAGSITPQRTFRIQVESCPYTISCGLAMFQPKMKGYATGKTRLFGTYSLKSTR